MEDTEFRIFTLNCWDIPILTKDRQARIKAIAIVLATSEYDFVCLQEVWSVADFILIKDEIIVPFPFSHYFHSGVIGSGLCIFSKYPLEDVFFRQWSVNGYFHKLQHGDWFGGKGVGLCCIKVNNYKINIYTAHLHAEYNQTLDEYQAHRVLQAFDTAQFIQLTSAGADLVILAGDLNIEPGSLAYRIFTSVIALCDTFNEANNIDKEFLYTNETPTNSYTPLSIIRTKSPGKRIDYIMYAAGSNVHATIKCFKQPLPDRVPGCTFSYSDHEAISATIALGYRDTPVRHFDINARTKVLDECISICDEALKHLGYHKRTYWFITALLFLTLIIIVAADVPFTLRIFFQVTKIIITVLMCFTFVMATFWNMIESNAIRAGKLAMQVKRRVDCS